MSTHTYVCKFGGSSLASAEQIAKAIEIINSHESRKYMVCSAPGKRYSKDQKITDLLYLCHELATRHLPIDDIFNVIAERYTSIAKTLKQSIDISQELAHIKKQIIADGDEGRSADYAASRGEYLNARILAEALDWTFVDAANIIFFNEDGKLDEERTYQTAAKVLAKGNIVIPGFYGKCPKGHIKTFSRGGSDVSGAIIARAIHAERYENWTDVSGLLITDPRIVPEASPIEVITYQELRELSYSGATVLHEDAVFPVRQVGIPVRICNTNAPNDPGTAIVPFDHPEAKVGYDITGIAGRKDFTVIQIEKAMMNSEIGFGRKVLQVIEDHDIGFEHMPSGIDTLSVVIDDNQLGNYTESLINDIQQIVNADRITVTDKMALITVVGRGMAHNPGLAARVLNALGSNNIDVRMIDAGSSQLNLIIGIDVKLFEAAVRAIYDAFIAPGGEKHSL